MKIPSLASFGFRKPFAAGRTFANEGSRWPSILRLLTRLFVATASAVIIGVIVHTLSEYYHTRGTNFSGIKPAWPQDLHLFPMHFVGVASVSLAFSVAMLYQSFRSRFSSPISKGNYVALALCVLLTGLWIANIVIRALSNNKGSVTQRLE